MNVISFDVDGTTIWGNPPGPITPEMIKVEIDKGNHVVGGSNHGIPQQDAEFRAHGIKLLMVCQKVGLSKAKEKWMNAGRYIHVGDSINDDGRAAKAAGFEYMTPEEYVESLNE